MHLKESHTIARGPGPHANWDFAPTNPSLAKAGRRCEDRPFNAGMGALGDHPETGAHPGPSPLPRDKMPRAFSGWSADLPDSQEKAPENLSTAMSALPAIIGAIGPGGVPGSSAPGLD